MADLAPIEGSKIESNSNNNGSSFANSCEGEGGLEGGWRAARYRRQGYQGGRKQLDEKRGERQRG